VKKVFVQDAAVFKDRLETVETVQRLRIPTSMLASAAGVSTPRCSDYLKHRAISTGTAERIKEAASKIGFVWQTFAPYRIILDDPKLLDRAVADARLTAALRESGIFTLLS
jgi:hypothetical protein